MNKQKIKSEGFMDFEYMLRQFLGDKTYGLQGIRENETAMRRQLKKVIKKIERRIDGLDTTNRHKEMLFREVEKLKDDFKNQNIDPWTVIIHLLSLISRLLGYDYLKGFINTPMYYQTNSQYYSQIIYEGGDAMQNYYDQKNLVHIRKEVYKELKEKGYSDFKVAQIMNTTEYKIKKLKDDL